MRSKDPQRNCAGCKHWSSRDPSLDGGREIIGTCNKPLDFQKVVYEETRAAAFQEGEFLKRMRARLKNDKWFLQLAGNFEGDVRAYKRCTADHYCDDYESRVPIQQPSLTESSVTT